MRREAKSWVVTLALLSAIWMAPPSFGDDEEGDGSEPPPTENPGDTGGLEFYVTGGTVETVHFEPTFFFATPNFGGGGMGPDDDPPQPEEPPSPPDECAASSNPVIYATGNKVKTEVDFETRHQSPLRLVRQYNRNSSSRRGLFGSMWFSNLDTSLRFKFTGGGVCDALPGQTTTCITPSTASSNIISVVRFTPSGSQQVFNRNATANNWQSPDKDATEVITRAGDGTWTVTSKSGAVDRFNSSGFITSSTDEYGLALTFTYSTTFLQRVTHANGKFIQLGWNGNRVSTVTDPGNNIYGYVYSTSGFLSQVTTPGPQALTTTYHYESTVPGALTGISLNGVRYSTYDYYSDGRVFHSGLAGGVEKDTFVYGTNSDGTTYTQVTNALGAVVKMSYSVILGKRKLVRIDRSGVSNCPSVVSQIAYDSNGFKDFEVDFAGNRTEYTYGPTGLIEDMTTGIHPSHPGKQRFIDYVWNSATNRLLSVRTYGAGTSDPIAETVYDYYATGSTAPNRIKSVTTYNRSAYGLSGQPRTISYSYTAHPNKMLASVSINGPRTDVTDISTQSFDAAGNFLSATDAAGNQYVYSGHNGLGLPTTIRDPNMVSTQYVYNGRGQILSQTAVLSTGNRTTSFTYHPLGPTAKVTRPDSSVLVFEYDGAGRLVGQHMDGYQRIDYTRNLLGNVTRERRMNSCPSVLPPNTICSKELRVTYERSWEYDQLGRLAAANGYYGQRTQYLYDNNGNVREVKETGTTTKITTLTYGPHNELLTSINPLSQQSTFAYDGAGRLKQVTDPKGLVTTYRTDGFGNLVEQNSPDSGISTATFDEAGNRVTFRWANGTLVSYSFDALNRVISAVSGGRTDSYGYDTCANGKERLCNASEGNNTDAFAYTQTGQLASQSSVIAASTYLTTRTYDALDRLVQIIYPGGVQALYEYNNQDQITAVKAVVGGVTKNVATGIAYKFFGPKTSYTLGNGTNRTVDWDLNYRILSNSPNLTYSHNAFDEISNIYDQANVGLEYQLPMYDDLSRLRTIVGGGSGNEQGITFDANGNRESYAIGGQTDDYVPQANSNRIGSILGPRARSYTFDGRGNTSTESGWRGNYVHGYDNITNRLNKSTKDGVLMEYHGNAFNQRVRKKSTTVHLRFVYDPTGALMAETQNNSSAVGTHYIWLGSEPLALVRGGALYYVLSDHLGRPREVQNGSKTAVWKANNSAFDRVVTLNTFGGLNLGFPGQYYDIESGLWYNWNRTYDASMGRYIQPDPLGLLGGFSAYAYVGGNPVNFIDPLGLFDVYAHPIRGDDPWRYSVRFYGPLSGLGREIGNRTPFRGINALEGILSAIQGDPAGVSTVDNFGDRRACDAGDSAAKDVYKDVLGSKGEGTISESNLRLFLDAYFSQYPQMEQIYGGTEALISGAQAGGNRLPGQ